MILTREEKSMLSGRRGYAKQKSMEIVVALGKIYGADRLLDVESVQVAGVSYHNLGDAGIEYLESMAKDGRIAKRVNATLNPSGMDMVDWKSLGIGKDFAEKQKRIIMAYRKMGISDSCTCVPYLTGNFPRCGEHVSWSESSAVCYANSVLGAMTNREGGPSSLASAITGKTANYGFHLKKNRKAHVLVDVKYQPKGEADYGALGHAIANKVKNKVLFLKGLDWRAIKTREMQSFCASSATYGGTAMFHIRGFTPEWRSSGKPKSKITISRNDIKKSYEFLRDGCKPDFIAVGCPHLCAYDLAEIARLLDGKKVSKEFWIFLPRSEKIFLKRNHKDIVSKIEKSGAMLVADTCMAVAPLKGRFRCLATNSAKACFYGRGSNDFKTILCSLEDCVKYATVKDVKGRG